MEPSQRGVTNIRGVSSVRWGRAFKVRTMGMSSSQLALGKNGQTDDIDPP